MPERVLPEVLPARAARLEMTEFESGRGVEQVVLDLRTRRAHLLAGSIAIVFDACDGSTTADSVVQDFVKVLGMTEPDARALIARALDDLGALYLLDGPEPPSPDLSLHPVERTRRWWHPSRRAGGP